MSKNLGTIEKLMSGFNPYRQRMEETRGLVKKWEPTGLLEGIDTDQKTHGMAVLLENQDDHLNIQQFRLYRRGPLLMLFASFFAP